MSKLILLLAIMLAPSVCFGGVLWQTAFNDLEDWGQVYLPSSAGNPRTCNVESPNSSFCTTYGAPPPGFYYWFMSPSFITPITGNGMKIDNFNDHQGDGKALTVYDLHHQDWSGNSALGFHLPEYDGYEEIFVRYWMRYQPGYSYGTQPNTYQKTSHISHYIHNGLPHMYFGSGGNFPTEYQQINRDGISTGDGVADAAMTTTFRGSLGNYNLVQPDNTIMLGEAKADGVKNYFDMDGDGLPLGNNKGTGTDFGDSYANGNWHCFEFYLKNNSSPGTPDGVYKFFFDGKLLAHKDTVVYRDSISPLGEKVWNLISIGGNTRFNILPEQTQIEYWRAFDDVVVYTPMTGAETECGGACVDGRLPLSYTPAGATTIVPEPEPTVEVPPRIRANTRANVR